MEKEGVPEEIANDVIKKEVQEVYKQPFKRRHRHRIAMQLKQDLTKQDENKNEEPTPQTKPNYIRPSINYEIKPFGADQKNTMSDLEFDGEFCVYINSENPKYISLEKTNNKLGLALHIAESVIGELMRYNNADISHNEIKEKMSEFYEKSFDNIKV